MLLFNVAVYKMCSFHFCLGFKLKVIFGDVVCAGVEVGGNGKEGGRILFHSLDNAVQFWPFFNAPLSEHQVLDMEAYATQ